MALSADASNSDCKKYLHIIKANNLINLRKTSKHFPMQKAETFSPAYFLSCFVTHAPRRRPLPLSLAANSLPLEISEYANWQLRGSPIYFSFSPPTAAMLSHYSHLSLPLPLPSPLSSSLSLSVSLFRLLFTLCWPLNIEQPLTN